MAMKPVFKYLAIGTLLLAAACARAGFAVANLPAHFSDIEIKRNVPFDPAEKLALDIYRPKHASGPLPVIVFFYGGRWTYGERGEYTFAGATLAKLGYVVVIPDYRKYPAVKFPAFVEDGAASVSWVRANIASYGGIPDQIFLAGHSAGAHIGALLASDRHYLKADYGAIKGFAGLAGPYAFTPDEADLQDMFGPPARYPQMQATSFIDGHEPPMLLLYGDADTSVKKINIDRLEARIHEKGGCVKTIIYPGIDHKWIVGALSWVGRSKAPVIADMAGFFSHPGCS
jgi:acetyl esterase/lipase